MTALRGSENGNRFSPTGREMRTASGLLIDVTNPRPEQMLMADIATGLAHKERFGGHNPLRPTVAQHSLAVECIAVRLCAKFDGNPPPLGLRRAALMHDADEAHLVDIIGAVKKAIRPDGGAGESAYDVLAGRFMRAIETRFSCAADGWEEIVHEADCLACAYEMMMGWGESDKAVPAWLLELDLERFYPLRSDGRRQFIARAAQLGMTDAPEPVEARRSRR